MRRLLCAPCTGLSMPGGPSNVPGVLRESAWEHWKQEMPYVQGESGLYARHVHVMKRIHLTSPSAVK